MKMMMSLTVSMFIVGSISAACRTKMGVKPPPPPIPRSFVTKPHKVITAHIMGCFMYTSTIKLKELFVLLCAKEL